MMSYEGRLEQERHDRQKQEDHAILLAKEALANAKGLIDHPIGRRRHAGESFYKETVDSIRLAIAALEELDK